MGLEEKNLVSGCCGAEMIPPDWEAAEEAGSMWIAYACYICKTCGKVCDPVEMIKEN